MALTPLLALMMWLTSTYEAPLLFPLALATCHCPFSVGCVADCAIGLGGVVAFSPAKTTVNPITPEATTTMVTSGLYRFSRNPMYLGLLLMLIGWAIFLSNPLAFALLPLFALYMEPLSNHSGGTILSTKFAYQFRAYKKTVRRWI